MTVLPAQVLSVTELTHRVKDLLEERFPSVWVEGEISNVRSPSSGHIYFTLKDSGAQLAVVLFRGVAAKVGFKLKDGLQVITFGDISVYEKNGQYQLVARQLLPKGFGALQLAFEELKQRLAKEGLFDSSRKRPIPAIPQRIGLVTSPTVAAIRDFLNIIDRRFPNVQIVIHPVRVQGEGAAAEIAAAIDDFNALRGSPGADTQRRRRTGREGKGGIQTADSAVSGASAKRVAIPTCGSSPTLFRFGFQLCVSPANGDHSPVPAAS